jgi:hypothetical protein
LLEGNRFKIYDAEELITIPQLPIDFDFELIEDGYIAFESLDTKVGKPRKEVLISEFKMYLYH